MAVYPADTSPYVLNEEYKRITRVTHEKELQELHDFREVIESPRQDDRRRTTDQDK